MILLNIFTGVGGMASSAAAGAAAGSIVPGIGTAIGAGVGALGSIINSIGVNKTNKANEAYALKMYNMQRNDNLKFWGMQNEYNSPQAQMTRLQSAGLNPNLVYSNQSGANNSANIASPTPSGFTRQSPQWANGVVSATDSYFDLRAKQAQYNNLRLQNTVIAEQALNAHLDNVDKSRELGYLQGQGLYKGRSLALAQYIDHLRSMVLGIESDNAKFAQPFFRKGLVQEYQGKKLSNQFAAANIQSVLSNIGFRSQEVKNHTRTVELAQQEFFQRVKEGNWRMSQGDKQYLHMIYQDAFQRSMSGNDQELRNTIKRDLESSGMSGGDVLRGVSTIMDILQMFNKGPKNSLKPQFQWQRSNGGMSPNQDFNF